MRGGRLRDTLPALEQAIGGLPDTADAARRAAIGAGRVAAAIAALRQAAAPPADGLLATLVRDRRAYARDAARIRRRLRLRIAGLRLRIVLRTLWRWRWRILGFAAIASAGAWVAMNPDRVVALVDSAIRWLGALMSDPAAATAATGGAAPVAVPGAGAAPPAGAAP